VFIWLTQSYLSLLLGRVNTAGFLFYIVVWHIAVYCPIAHMMWAHQGWFHAHHVEDFSGGLVVHMLAGLTTFCAHYFLGRDEMPHLLPVMNAGEALKAMFLVWFLWFGYTAGKAFTAGPEAAQAIMNVFVAPIASALVSFFYELIFERSITPMSITTALLLGLIGITPAAGYVTVGGAMCIGIITYLVTQTVANTLYLEGLSINAPLSITTAHGLGGTVGFLCTAIFSYKFVNPAALDGATWGNGKPILYHFILCLLFYTCATLANFVVLYLCNLIVPLKGSEDKEAQYPDFSLIADSTEANVPAAVAGLSPRVQSVRMASSGRSGLSRRIEVGISQRMQYNRSMRSLGHNKSGVFGEGSSGKLSPASPSSPTGRTLSVGPLGANKSFRAAAMQDLELTQSSQL
jgi:Amt family ammonium transporter